MNANKPLILGSSSRFRQEQLRALQLPFQVAKPHCDETPLAGESAADTAMRLAEGKARSLVAEFPNALIIGADQVAWYHHQQLGKPLTLAKAQSMLHSLSGQNVQFFSALVLLNSAENRIHRHVDITTVTMRPLTDAQIDRYLHTEPDAVYCAGAAKSEGLGASLIQRIDSTDPNALIGLPIFQLVDFLLAEGVDLP